MNNSTLRNLAGVAVCLVAAIAAVISYEHVYHLAVTLGQPQLAAWLMPLSVDGSIGAASAALLSAARTGHRSPRIAQAMLALGVLATLTANAYSGSAHGIAGMALAMWPGIAFIGSTETALSMVRRSVTQQAAKAEPDVQPVAIETLTAAARPSLTLAWPRPSSVGGVTVNRAPEGVPAKRAPAKRASTAKPRASVTPETAFAAELAAGMVPSLRRIKSTLRVGTNRARDVRDHLIAVTAEGAA